MATVKATEGRVPWGTLEEGRGYATHPGARLLPGGLGHRLRDRIRGHPGTAAARRSDACITAAIT